MNTLSSSTKSIFPFQSPPTKNGDKLLDEFKATGKYSKAFLDNLSKGMNQSKFFNKKSSK